MGIKPVAFFKRNRLFVLLLFAGSSNAFSQQFELIQPDTSQLKQKLNYQEPLASITYDYFLRNYEVISSKDSIDMNPNDPSSICGFYQAFEQGIKYRVSACEVPEGIGFEEIFSFPKVTDLKKVQAFIEIMYHDDYNKWVSDYRYEPEEGGCYYKIIQTKTRTIIERWCGC